MCAKRAWAMMNGDGEERYDSRQESGAAIVAVPMQRNSENEQKENVEEHGRHRDDEDDGSRIERDRDRYDAGKQQRCAGCAGCSAAPHWHVCVASVYFLVSAANPVLYISLPYRLTALAKDDTSQAAAMMGISCWLGAVGYSLSLATPIMLRICRHHAHRRVATLGVFILALGVVMMLIGNKWNSLVPLLVGTGVLNLGQSIVLIIVNRLILDWASAVQICTNITDCRGRAGGADERRARATRLLGVRSMWTVSGSITAIVILGSTFPILSADDNAYFLTMLFFAAVEVLIFSLAPSCILRDDDERESIQKSSSASDDPSTRSARWSTHVNEDSRGGTMKDGDSATGDENRVVKHASYAQEDAAKDVGASDNISSSGGGGGGGGGDGSGISLKELGTVLFSSDYGTYRRVCLNNVAFMTATAAFSANSLYFIENSIRGGNSDDAVSLLSQLSIAIQLCIFVSVELGVRITKHSGAKGTAVLASVLNASVLLLMPFVRTMPQLYALSFFFSFGQSIFDVADVALVGESVPERLRNSNLTRDISLWTVIMSLAQTVGSSLMNFTLVFFPSKGEHHHGYAHRGFVVTFLIGSMTLIASALHLVAGGKDHSGHRDPDDSSQTNPREQESATKIDRKDLKSSDTASLADEATPLLLAPNVP